MKKIIANQKKLHVVFLDYDDVKNPLLSGGQARATFEIAKRLVKMGHRVTIVCSKYPHSKDYYSENVFYKHIGLGTNDLRKNNIAFFLALPFAVRILRADVIVECFTAPISTCFSPLFTKIPVIGMPTIFEAEEFSKKYHIPFHWVERFGCKFYKYFIAYSTANKIKMRGYNKDVIVKTIPNGVSEEYFSVKEKEKKYALFIGRIDSFQKGLDLLIDACKLLVKNNAKHSKKAYPLKILLAGNGTKDEEKRLKSLIARNKLSHFVSFIGRIDGKKKERIISNAVFGIFPSRFEDFPLVPLEFASLEKPIVCFDIKGLAWLPDNVALKVKKFNVEELANAIHDMTYKKNLRNKFKKNCRKFAKQYGWNDISLLYQEFFYDVIERDNQSKKRAYL